MEAMYTHMPDYKDYQNMHLKRRQNKRRLKRKTEKENWQ
jgi:hypothetical protein